MERGGKKLTNFIIQGHSPYLLSEGTELSDFQSIFWLHIPVYSSFLFWLV